MRNPISRPLTSRDLLRALAVACSAFLLAASFPPMENWEAAWVGLVPLIVLALFSTPKQALRWGFACGGMFWLGSLPWLLRLYCTGGPLPLVVLAWLALSAYCALYVAAFTGTTAWLAQRLGIAVRGRETAMRYGSIRRVAMVLLVPLLWVGWEYLRSTLLTGFSWNALGVSQFRNRPVIQVAEWGGVYAVSAVMVALNTALALTLTDLLPAAKTPRRRLRPELMLGLGLCMALWVWGTRRVTSVRYDFAEAQTLRVAAIQPNIPQDQKWEEAVDAVSEILLALKTQTESAIRVHPDLVVWPETALPGIVPPDVEADAFVRDMARLGVPILTGAVEADRSDDGKSMDFWNAAILYNTNGLVGGRYRKVHLVPFGEYIPLGGLFPVLERLAPLGFSCRAGDEQTVFTIGPRSVPISSLICFEDSVPPLSRRSVKKGAALLINQTNDAWFDGSAGAVQHMSQCVLRCVENRVAAVRCANTGVTCYIDPTGRIQALAADEDGRPVRGFATFGAVLRPASLHFTLYTRYGDWLFAIPCAIFASVIAVAAFWEERKKVKR